MNFAKIVTINGVQVLFYIGPDADSEDSILHQVLSVGDIHAHYKSKPFDPTHNNYVLDNLATEDRARELLEITNRTLAPTSNSIH